MKITKGQLKRIIAEEHALVYGEPKRKTSKRRSLSRKAMLESRRRKREIMIEAKAKILAEEMIQEGWFTDMLSGLGAAAKSNYKKVKSAASDAWQDTKAEYAKGVAENQEKEKAAADKKALEFAEGEAKSKYKEYLEGLSKILLKGGYSDDEAKAKAGELALAWGTASVPSS